MEVYYKFYWFLKNIGLNMFYLLALKCKFIGISKITTALLSYLGVVKGAEIRACVYMCSHKGGDEGHRW